LKQQGWDVSKLLNGYLRWLRDRKTDQALALREDSVPYGEDNADLEAWLASLHLQPM
jgi:hypothetical protein